VVRIRRFHQVKAGRVGARLLSILLWGTPLATALLIGILAFGFHFQLSVFLFMNIVA